jgi:hypothetical protein
MLIRDFRFDPIPARAVKVSPDISVHEYTAKNFTGEILLEYIRVEERPEM